MGAVNYYHRDELIGSSVAGTHMRDALGSESSVSQLTSCVSAMHYGQDEERWAAVNPLWPWRIGDSAPRAELAYELVAIGQPKRRGVPVFVRGSVK